jgi:hypothetical protein
VRCGIAGELKSFSTSLRNYCTFKIDKRLSEFVTWLLSFV